MGSTTNISWTDSSANLWWGCAEVHAGCDFCYARVFASRVGKGNAWQGRRYAVSTVWPLLALLQKRAAADGTSTRVFVGSMMDIGEKSLPVVDWQGNPLSLTTGELRDRLCRDVVPQTPNLQYQFLTKRPGNIAKVVPPAWLDHWPANVITGASVVDQETVDTLMPQLVRVPGRRFVSYEPALGAVDLSPWLGRLAWVIAGGESGATRRPCEVGWFEAVAAQCDAASVPLFMKQDSGRNPGERGRLPDELWARKEHPDAVIPSGQARLF